MTLCHLDNISPPPPYGFPPSTPIMLCRFGTIGGGAHARIKIKLRNSGTDGLWWLYSLGLISCASTSSGRTRQLSCSAGRYGRDVPGRPSLVETHRMVGEVQVQAQAKEMHELKVWASSFRLCRVRASEGFTSMYRDEEQRTKRNLRE